MARRILVRPGGEIDAILREVDRIERQRMNWRRQLLVDWLVLFGLCAGVYVTIMYGWEAFADYVLR